MKPNSQKRSFDCPDELYAHIMEYAIKFKLYKFGPALIDVINKGLTSVVKES